MNKQQNDEISKKEKSKKIFRTRKTKNITNAAKTVNFTKNKEQEKLKIEKQLLELENAKLKIEIDRNNKDFSKKVEELTIKAKEEIEKHKQANSEKTEKELQEIKKYGIQKFFEAFLLPLNNLELAINAGIKQDNPAVQNYVKGFSMLFNQMQQTFNDFGIEKIEPKIGEEFNSDMHQIFELEENSEKQNLILQVKSNGYKLHDRVIKPALVVVGK